MFISKSLFTNFVLSLTLIFLTLSFNAHADNDKIKDQSLAVEINNKSCAIYVRNDSPTDNCKEFENNPCKNSSQCVCSKKDKYISWQADKPLKFEIVFTTEDTPFHKSNCQLKSGDSPQIRCKVHHKGEFEYDVHVEGCEGKPYDPKIIVK